MKYRNLFITVIMLLAVSVITAHADTVNIIDLGEGNYTSQGDMLITITGTQGQTINNAVNVIPAGGTILLNGNFSLNETINIKKPLTIRSINGSVLDGQNKKRVLRCQGKGFVLENLTITGGLAPLEGGGINLEACSIDIINCKITGNSVMFGIGSGINIKSGCTVRLTSCDISGNSFKYYGLGGGIYSSSTTLEINDCSISSNDAKNGGGGIYASGGNLVLNNCTVTSNDAEKGGGGLYLSSTSSQANNCAISGNTPDDIKGTITIDGTVYTAESLGISESEPEAEAESETEGSGGGCNASCLGLITAIIFIMRKRKHD